MRSKHPDVKLNCNKDLIELRMLAVKMCAAFQTLISFWFNVPLTGNRLQLAFRRPNLNGHNNLSAASR